MSAQQHPAIEVVGARTHNLKGIDCRIPHAKVTVVTGLSGAGKSSLVFDTVYAEAQRRFVESMSTYARQFLNQMERPPIEAMHGILPAVALEARNSIKNARSTVGTITDVHDILRLIFTHLGEVSCPNGHGSVRRHTPQEVADAIAAGEAGEKVMLLAHLKRPKKLANVKLKELVRQGYYRRWDDGVPPTVVRMKPSDRWLVALDPLPLVLGRYQASKGVTARLAEAIEEAFQLTGGKVQVLDAESGTIVHFGRALTCNACGASMPRPVPALFSFNSPLGACPTCQGFGRVIGIDPERVIPDPSKSLEEKPIAPWNTPAHAGRYSKLFQACREQGIPLDVPWQELSEEDRAFVWSGKGRFASLDKFFKRLERKIYKMHVRILLSRYRAYNPCPDCGGSRLKPEALAVRMHGEVLPGITAMTIERLRGWLKDEAWSRREKEVAGDLLAQLDERLETLHRVGLDYLSLDRHSRTLSGGEAQRIQLAAALGSGLTSTLYVLDEPTIGLHPQDSGRLVDLLRDLARRGNTVLVVEHDRTLIRGADHVIDLGPMAGEHGGEVVAEGTLDDVMAQEGSLTASYLRERPATPARRASRQRRANETSRQRRANETPRREQGLASLEDEVASRPRIEILGATANNLRGFDVQLPLASLVAVTGVSGSGKSTLIENVLHGTYQRSRGVVDVEPGDCEGFLGLEEIVDITLVDQRPLGRSSRSNPVTYTKAYDEIRKLFAATEDARRRGIEPGHFSFNLDRGRCEECRGTGVLEVDMQFMAPVTVRCDTCEGRRFKPEILSVTCRGRNIAETLEITVDEALDVFADRPRLCRRLRSLADVGLGYLRLGQPTSTLSGGEAQRLKLASFLDRPPGKASTADGRRLFLFDEPTTGLHLADIDLLCQTLRRLVARGHGVVVVEHATDLIARADWIVDLGPGGGVHGGDLLYSGPLETFLDRVESPTARELRRHLKWRRRRKTAVARSA
ncbi:MAG: excinuclease ABC subunit UvrA [bacterium]|nr:excinuclease ABC subunit UvrA [bacterium]